MGFNQMKVHKQTPPIIIIITIVCQNMKHLTHERLEVKFTSFGRVDHLWPHKAGDCDYLERGCQNISSFIGIIVS